MATEYNTDFYKEQESGSYKSAKEIIPVLFDLYRPKSVLDVGCGLGTWLSAFKEFDPSIDLRGLDGDYVKKEMLYIDTDNFVSYDLTKPYTSDKKFDMAMSLEVGEHLPEAASDVLVDTLTNASDVVMFSASIPGQIGTYHINEQYTEYWAKKFVARGYVAVDYFRKKIWDNTNIKWWYRQNTILYIKKGRYEADFKEKLESYRVQTDPDFLTRIHPEMLDYYYKKFLSLSTYEGFARHKLYPVKLLFKKK